MIIEQSKQIISEINRAFIGKNDIIEKVLMTIYAGGHSRKTLFRDMEYRVYMKNWNYYIPNIIR